MSKSPFWLPDVQAIDPDKATSLAEVFAAYQEMGAGGTILFEELERQAQQIAQAAGGSDTDRALGKGQLRAWQQSAQTWREEATLQASARQQFYERLPDALDTIEALQQAGMAQLESATHSALTQESAQSLQQIQKLQRGLAALDALGASWQVDRESAPVMRQAGMDALHQQQMTLMQTEIALTGAFSKAAPVAPSGSALSVIIGKARPVVTLKDVPSPSLFSKWMDKLKGSAEEAKAHVGQATYGSGYILHWHTKDDLVAATQVLKSGTALVARVQGAHARYEKDNRNTFGYALWVNTISSLRFDTVRETPRLHKKLARAALSRSPSEWGEALSLASPASVVDLSASGRAADVSECKGAGAQLLLHVLSAPQLKAVRQRLAEQVLDALLLSGASSRQYQKAAAWLRNPNCRAMEVLNLCAADLKPNTLAVLSSEKSAFLYREEGPLFGSETWEKLLMVPTLPERVRSEIVGMGIKAAQQSAPWDSRTGNGLTNRAFNEAAQRLVSHQGLSAMQEGLTDTQKETLSSMLGNPKQISHAQPGGVEAPELPSFRERLTQVKGEASTSGASPGSLKM